MNSNLNINNVILSSKGYERNIIDVFDAYAQIYEFEYFLGGQYLHATEFINYMDSAENRAKLADIISQLRVSFPSVLTVEQSGSKLIEVDALIKRLFQASKSPNISRLLFPVEPESKYIESISSENTMFLMCFKPWSFNFYYEGNSFYEPRSGNIRNSCVRRLKPETFDDLLKLKTKAKAKFLQNPSLIDFPIDVVYTWVNGDDEDWINKKSFFQTGEINKRVYQNERYKSRGELCYSIRSLELYAPWINKIYVVTDSQIPDWIDIDKASSRVTFVDHKDIMEADYLPCFNSSAIETFLHRIEGLSEHFLYLTTTFYA